MKRIPFVDAIDRIENASELDPLISRVRKVVQSLIQPRWVRDVLHGVPLGHPLHPMLAQVTLGAWVSAGLLDAMPGTERAAKSLIGTGLLTVLPSAVSGATDWSELQQQQQRVGLVHAISNVVASGLYVASLVQRRNDPTRGKVSAYAGLAVATIGGFLGGHLAYRQAAGANHTEDVPHRVPAGWHPIGQLDELPDGELTQRSISGMPLAVFRAGNRVSVLSDTCSHLSGPLHEGELVNCPSSSRLGYGDEAELCVVCPWHQSVFSLSTGEVVHGPATSPQPHFQTRVEDGIVQVRLPGAD
ncbi:MAG: Rieske 2Fe-2S domain-containing protein [Microbacteriaceae bacterium]